MSSGNARRLMVLASAGVDAVGDSPFVTGYVVLSAKGASRIFKVKGPAASPSVVELPSATTIDLGRFQRELSSEVEPLLEAKRAVDAPASLSTPAESTLIEAVTRHLEKSSS